MSANYEIRIGDVTLRDEIMEMDILKDDAERPRYRVARIVLDLDKINPAELNVHWPAIVDQIDGVRKRVLYGVITEVKYIDTNRVLIVCRGAERYFEEYRTNLVFDGFSVPEQVFYIGRRVPEVGVQERNIEGLSLKKNSRRFRVIMPILNLTVGKQSSVFGVLLRPSDPNSEDDKVIAEYKIDTIWNKPIAWAETTVEAVYFDEAAIEARKRIVTALD